MSAQLRRDQEQQAALLDHVVEKLLKLGEQAGVAPNQIAAMLNSGMKVDELIRHLVLKLHGCPEASREH